MNYKKTSTIAILIVLTVTSPFLFLNSAATSTPVLSIVQSGTISTNAIPSATVGSTFNVDVRVDNTAGISPGINAASYSITWDPTILKCTKTADGTTFWGSKGQYLGNLGADNTKGIATYGQIILDTSNPLAISAQSTGVLATLTFQVLKTGQCTINLTKSDPDVEFMTYPISSGSVGVKPVSTVNSTYGAPATTPPPTVDSAAPQGNFTPTEGSILALGSNVTLDASSSQPGYDSAGGFICNISSYAWRVEYMNGTDFASLNGKSVSFTASDEGAFRIILILTAIDPKPSNPDFKITGSTSATVYVISNPQATKIDTYSDKGGIGVDARCGQYSPLQTLQMYALVKNNNISLTNQNVLFTIQNSNKSIIATRQGVTNGSGIATAQFRLPCPDPNSPQTTFGTWYITALVNSSSLSANDSSAFDFSYSSYLGGFQKVQMPTSVHRLETLPIQVTVNSSYYPFQWSQLSITVFDQAGIPIGSSTVSTSQTQVLTVISSDITIPSWAFTGQAKVCICLLTNSSNSQAVPLSPETVATFTILH